MPELAVAPAWLDGDMATPRPVAIRVGVSHHPQMTANSCSQASRGSCLTDMKIDNRLARAIASTGLSVRKGT